MKKLILALLVITSITSILYGCGSKQKDDKISSEILNHYYHDDFYYDYNSEYYKFRIPEYWKNKFTVVNTLNKESFYEINSYNENETGLLFSIYTYDDESYKNELKDYIFLCYDKRFEKYYIMTIPKEPEYVEDFSEEYQKLQESLNVVKATFEAER